VDMGHCNLFVDNLILFLGNYFAVIRAQNYIFSMQKGKKSGTEWFTTEKISNILPF